MKRKMILLSLFSLSLVSCGGVSSIKPTSSSTVTITKPNTTSKNTQGSTSKPIDTEGTTPTPTNSFETLLVDLKKGYSFEFIITNTSTKSKNIVDVSTGLDGYHYKEFEGTTEGAPTKDSVVYDEYFVSDPKSKLVSLATLGLDNQLSYQSIENGILFSESPYVNAFQDLSVDDFDSEGNNIYQLDDSTEAFSILSQQILPIEEKVKATSFSFVFLSNKIEVKAAFDSIVSQGETYSLSFDGTLLAKGEQAYEAPKPLSGEEDPAFKGMMEKLRTGNFNERSTFSKYQSDIGDFVPESILSVESDGTTSYDIKSYSGTGDLIGENGFVKNAENKVQAIFNTAEESYADGYPMNDDLSALFPKFNISSLFFEKSAINSKGTLSYYRLKEDLPTYVVLPYADSYDKLAPTKTELKNLILAFDTDPNNEFVEFIDETSSRRLRTLYDNIGKNEDVILPSSYNDTSDNATWSSLLSLSAAEGSNEYQVITDSVQSMDVLDQLPVFGGVYANNSILLTEGNYLEIRTNAFGSQSSTKEKIDALKNNYIAKLKSKDYGFVDSTAEPQDGGTVYEKSDVTYTDPDTMEEVSGTLSVEVKESNEDGVYYLSIYPYFEQI